jgi:hypothetical protein
MTEGQRETARTVRAGLGIEHGRHVRKSSRIILVRVPNGPLWNNERTLDEPVWDHHAEAHVPDENITSCGGWAIKTNVGSGLALTSAGSCSV